MIKLTQKQIAALYIEHNNIPDGRMVFAQTIELIEDPTFGLLASFPYKSINRFKTFVWNDTYEAWERTADNLGRQLT